MTRRVGPVVAAVAVAILSSWFAVPVEPASACSCGGPTLTSVWVGAETLLIGSATDVVPSPDDRYQTVTVAVSAMVLGEADPVVTFRTEVDDGGNCGAELIRVGQTIAAIRWPGGPLSTGACTPRPSWIRSQVAAWKPPPGGVAHGLVLGAWDSQIAFLDAVGAPIGYTSPLPDATGMDVCPDGRAAATVAGGDLIVATLDGSAPPQTFPVGVVSGHDPWAVRCFGPAGSATSLAVFEPEDVATSIYRLLDGELVKTTPAPGRGLIPLGFHGDAVIVADQRGEFQVLATLDLDGTVSDLASNSVGNWRLHREPTGRFALATASTPRDGRDPHAPAFTHAALIDLTDTTPVVKWERAFHARYDADVQWGPDATVVALAPESFPERASDWLHLQVGTGKETLEQPTVGVRVGEVVIRAHSERLDITAADGELASVQIRPDGWKPTVRPLESPIEIAPNTLHHPVPRLDPVTQPPAASPPTTKPPEQSAPVGDSREDQADARESGRPWAGMWLGIGLGATIATAAAIGWLRRRRRRRS